LTALTDEHGNVIQPGYSVSEILPFFIMPTEESDFTANEPWPNADNPAYATQTGGLWALGNALLKVFVHKNDPAFSSRDLYTFTSGGGGDVTAYRAVISETAANKVLKSADKGIGHIPEKLSKLIRQDGKFLIWHNLSDEKLTPYMSYNYYKKLAGLYGGYDSLQKNVRFFPLPGTAHCSGGGMGTGPGSFDALTAMENWVEKGEAPNELIATLYQPTAWGVDFSKPAGRTMPLCKFPEMAKYSGKGGVNDAANWSCPKGDTRMLEVGESGRQAGVIQ